MDIAVSEAETQAMRRALALAATPGVPLGPNPRVGCVLLDGSGGVAAEGFHHGAGHPHAEAAALAVAGDRAAGATAVVTLEPCNHTGRTPPCSRALVDAGVRRVVFAQADPNPVASGGTATLRAAGVEVVGGVLADEAAYLNRAWTFGIVHGRPLVTWKFATTLDGRSAAADGTSRWVSARPARLDTHRLRAECDVMLVGTNTVQVDDPRLTVRGADDLPLPHQPLRAVMGLRELGADRCVFDDSAESVRLRTRDPEEALAELFGLGRRHVFCEGGPTLAAALLTAGLIDEVVTYVAPMLLGAGRSAVGDLGIGTIADALHLQITDVCTLGAGAEQNIRITMGTPRRTARPQRSSARRRGDPAMAPPGAEGA